MVPEYRSVGFAAVAISAAAATVIGITPAYYGGLLGMLLQRLVDIWLSFPGLVMPIGIIAVIDRRTSQLAIAIGLLISAGFSHVFRSSSLVVCSSQYIEAAHAIEMNDLRIMLRHMLPNVLPVIIVVATVQLSAAILIESSPSSLGYGVPPPEPSWGGMLTGTGRTYFTRALWLAIWPGLSIALAVFGFNMLGDALRDVLDPRLRGLR